VPLMMADIYSTIKADSVLSQYPIIGASWPQATGCPFNTTNSLAQYVDWGDMHPYPTTNWYEVPQAYAGVSNYYGYTNDPINTIGDYAPDPYVWNMYYPAYSPKPMAFSETGYSTIQGGITETVHGKYIPRLFLENFRLGIKRTCIYELYDEGTDKTNGEENFGLVRFNFTVKPAYSVVKGLLGLLSDPGSTFSPAPLNINVTVSPVGDYTRTQYVHHLTFQKRDGTYYIVLWHEIALMNVYVTPYVNLPTPPDMPALLSFPGQTITSAVEYFWNDNGIVSTSSSTIKSTNTISTVARAQIRVIQVKFASQDNNNYIGCFIDGPTRDFSFQFDDTSLNTIDNCKVRCAVNEYSYAALQDSHQCFCGNSYGSEGSAPASDCNMACSGNSSEICGGGYRNSVYATSDIGYLGCFEDSSARDVSYLAIEATPVTVGSCRSKCVSLGYKYAALQDGYQCFCGNTYGSLGAAPAADCNTPCNGDSLEICGGGWRNSIFMA